MEAAHEPDKLRTLEAKRRLLGETYVSVYTDVARFRVTSGPTAGRDEFINLRSSVVSTKFSEAEMTPNEGMHPPAQKTGGG